jgi:hypothetical protein
MKLLEVATEWTSRRSGVKTIRTKLPENPILKRDHININPCLNNFWIHLPHSRGMWWARVIMEMTSEPIKCGKTFD